MGPPGISGLYFLSHSLAVLFVLWPRPTTTDPGARARRFIVSGERTHAAPNSRLQQAHAGGQMSGVRLYAASP